MLQEKRKTEREREREGEKESFEGVPLHDKELAKSETFTWLSSQSERHALVSWHYSLTKRE